MKKTYLAITILLLLTVAYFFFAHYYFYYKIKVAGLKPVDTRHTYEIKSPNASSSKLVYVALGDSLTSGAGTEKVEDSFPYLLAEKFAVNNNIILKNFSYPGAKTSHLIKDLLSPAIADKPDIITLLIGTNDIHGNVSADHFKKNYTHILDRLTKETKAKIYVISIPFIGAKTILLPPYNYYYDHKTAKYNNIIKELADTYKIKYIDLATPTAEICEKDGPHYSVDSFHPSAEGYKLWCEIIYADINK